MHSISEIKRISPAGSVILIHGSDLCMHEEQPTKAARPNEAMCDRLVMLLLLLLLLLPCCSAARFATAVAVVLPIPHIRREKGTRIGVLAGGGAAVHIFVSILERVQNMGARCYVIPGTRVQVLYIPVPV